MPFHGVLVLLSLTPVAPPAGRFPPSSCPAALVASALKAYPDAKVTACKKESPPGGPTLFELKLMTKAGRQLELDLAPDGALLQTEERVPLERVPKPVFHAFRTNHPTAPVIRAEKQTKADGTVAYEIAYRDSNRTREATFSVAGALLEEE